MASALTHSLPPKPPPMKGLTSRTFSTGIFRVVATPGICEVVAKRVFSARALVFYVHQIRGRPGLLEAFGNHESNRLAVARYFRPRKHRVGLAVIAGALRGGGSVAE